MPTLPTEPYPGLRPFLDHEAPLLMGRAQQVLEIINRLEATRFVAVVGGSGCGKSSLIRAGVVPRLRGFGMPAEGDYWIPVVYTPGTTRAVASSTQSDRPPHDESPVTRLARKFSQILELTSTSEEEAARRGEIADVFRQGAGFARLVERYSDELRPAGPDGATARFVFVIDQFEELFHPNNRGSEDAAETIKAVISHFYNPHDRCFVVLTMRSEHLADCAGYLELPDAINKSLYLVRRLNEQEVCEAIVGPAKYYLRLKQRAQGGVSIPDDVAFDERVIKRLVQDVGRIANDADHLPLLQHVLARTWYAACQREQVPESGVPRAVRWEDLERAVAPEPSVWLSSEVGEQINALRNSLENWAEYTFRKRSPAEQAQLEGVLRKLAFRDPTNGLYFQQRLDVNDPALLPGIPQPKNVLKELLQHGFLDTVNYLFWDDDNPARVTLKVSHEAFIRGWERFRKLIDREAERFDEFLSVLRKAANWSATRSPDKLLERSEIVRIDDANLGHVFTASDERRSWFQRLLEYRDGERLAQVDAQLDDFLSQSRKRVTWAQRWQRIALPAVATAFALAAVVSFLTFVYVPVLKSVMWFGDARKKNSASSNDANYQKQLRAKLESARLVADIEAQPLFAWVDRMQSIPPIASYKSLLEQSTSEPEVNGSLRDLLTRTVWITDRSPIGSPLRAVITPAACQQTTAGKLSGTLVQANSDPSRAMFVATDKSRDNGIMIRFYTADMRTGKCFVYNSFYNLPAFAEPAVVVDAQLAHLIVAHKSAPNGPDILEAFSLPLEATHPDAFPGQFSPLVDSLGQDAAARAVASIRSEVQGNRQNDLQAADTWLVPAGSIVQVGNMHWRFFANTTVPRSEHERESPNDWIRLQVSQRGSRCNPHGPNGAILTPIVFEYDSICFELDRKPVGLPATNAAGEAGLVWVLSTYTAFQSSTQDAAHRVPLASFPVDFTSDSQRELWIGKPEDKEWAGWVALKHKHKGLLFAPWATSAIAQLGCEVLAADAEHDGPCNAPTPAIAAPRRADLQR